MSTPNSVPAPESNVSELPNSSQRFARMSGADNCARCGETFMQMETMLAHVCSPVAAPPALGETPPENGMRTSDKGVLESEEAAADTEARLGARVPPLSQTKVASVETGVESANDLTRRAPLVAPRPSPARKRVEWFEEYSCGCVSEIVHSRRELLRYCAKHGNDRRGLFRNNEQVARTVLRRPSSEDHR